MPNPILINLSSPPLVVKDRIAFAAVYSRQPQNNIDFIADETEDNYTITFTNGVLLSGRSRLSYFRNMQFSFDEFVAIIQGQYKVNDIVLIDLVNYDIIEVLQFDSGWSYLKVKHTENTNILLQDTLDFAYSAYLTDREIVAIDWLVRQLNNPIGIIWPIVGRTVDEALRYLYPKGEQSSRENRKDVIPFGRNAGFILTDESLQEASLLNRNLSHQDTMHQFNLIMGRKCY